MTLSCVSLISTSTLSPYPHETLRKSQAELPGLNLKSSATLGTGRISSHKEILDLQEDKEVRRISKKTNINSMIDEDYHYFPPPDLTKSYRTSPEERARRSRTPDIRFVTGDAEATTVPVIQEYTASVTIAPASVGSALRRNADGSIAAAKVLPKRKKGSKVNETILYYIIIG